MLSTILVPLDGSALAERALPFAERLAGRSSAKVVLLRAAQAWTIPGSDPAEHQLKALHESEAYLERLADGLSERGISVEVASLYGNPARAILDAAHTRQADLIVMATHGRGGLRRWAYGSIADQVLRQAEKPVLLVPDKAAPVVLYCNGPFCGKSKWLSEELLEAGYTNVRRYQLGAPTWRALVGVMQIEPDGARYVSAGDRTAVWFDARSGDDFAAGSLPEARHLSKVEVSQAKDDGRLPMEDHNTRIIVFGADGAQAREVAQEIAKNAFHNVAYFDGSLDALRAALP
jgi:nucleotide-binding universal stress UspA family protein